MSTFILTITEAAPAPDTAPIEFYRRRIELPDIDAVLGRVDAALKFKQRKRRAVPPKSNP